MAIPFDRQEVKKWERINNNYFLDHKTLLGKGSYGAVYRGYSKIKDSLIAIKIVKNNALSKRQIETLQSLSSLIHPNIMGYYGESTKEENTFLFLEFCNNGTLADLIHQGISQLTALRLFREMVEGMCYMNAKQKMHRDFKPENILIGPQIDIKISDFGLSQSTNSIYVTGKRGTPIYSAPEVFLIHESYSFNCDVWSAGLILYEILKGQRLFKDVKDYNQLKQEWLYYQRGLKKATFSSNFHPLWDYFVNFMIQFDSKKRPSFHQVLENLKKVYDKMQQSITKKTSMIEDFNLHQANLYINYQTSKYQVLLHMCEKFTKFDIRVDNEFIYTCMFMCLLRYLLFSKDFIRSLRYKRLKYEGKDLLNESQQPEPEIEMFCDKSRFNLEHRLTFYSTQLKTTVISRIQNVYCKRQQSQEIMRDLEEVVSLIKRYSRGQAIQNNEELIQLFKNILIPIRKKIIDYKKKFNLDELRLYAHLLVCMLLEDKFPQSSFRSLDIEAEMNKINNKTKEELWSYIDPMYDEICK